MSQLCSQLCAARKRQGSDRRMLTSCRKSLDNPASAAMIAPKTYADANFFVLRSAM